MYYLITIYFWIRWFILSFRVWAKIVTIVWFVFLVFITFFALPFVFRCVQSNIFRLRTIPCFDSNSRRTEECAAEPNENTISYHENEIGSGKWEKLRDGVVNYFPILKFKYCQKILIVRTLKQAACLNQNLNQELKKQLFPNTYPFLTQNLPNLDLVCHTDKLR